MVFEKRQFLVQFVVFRKTFLSCFAFLVSSMSSSVGDKLSVVIGTYHCTVAQFDFDLENGTVDRKWVDDSASRSISSIVFNGFFSIFGGNDELVRIVNVASNQNVGALHEHQGSITHLETFQNTHLFSSSDDGKIYIWEIGGGHKHRVKHKKNMAKSWECLCCMHNFYDTEKRQKQIKKRGGNRNKNKNKNKHKNKNNNENDDELELSSNIENNSKILSFSIHPSGRLMISIDNAHKMKIWDLIRAKCIVTILMPKPAIDISWSPDGFTYSVVRQNKVLIYNKEGGLYKVIKPIIKLIDNEFYDRYQATIVSFTYITHDMIGIADMSARIVVYDIYTKTPLFRLSGHDDIHKDDDDDNGEFDKNENSKPRIRNLKVVSLNDNLYLISGDNRGRICVWNVHECLNRVITINSGNFEDKEEQDIDIEQEVENDDPLRDLNKQQNGNNNNDDDGKDDENESDDGDDEEDFIVDENGLFTFPALMQVDTQTHITCMDVGVVGRLNMMYKWKKPKSGNRNVVDNDNDQQEVSGKKRTFDEMEKNESFEKEENGGDVVGGDVVDSDDDEKLKQTNKKKKRKKKKKKRKIDLSRFD